MPLHRALTQAKSKHLPPRHPTPLGVEELNIKRSAIGSAPGSIDVLGGFAKAAGSLAIRALSEPKTTALLTEISHETLRLSSTRHGRYVCSIAPLKQMVNDRASLGEVKAWLDEGKAPHWAYHVLGSLFLFALRHAWLPEEGISFAIASDLPERQGLGSGVALKMACLRALEKLTARYARPSEIESIIAQVDTELLGMPFDPSSPLASALNKPGCLLPINCRQNQASAPIELPRGVTLFAWTRKQTPPRNSNWYQTQAGAAAIGCRIANAAFDRIRFETLPPPSIYHSQVHSKLPEILAGSDFDASYGAQASPFPKLQPTTAYPVRAAFAFAVRENRRVELALHLLNAMGLRSKRNAIEQMGELLWESHFDSKSAGMAASHSDQMVDALIAAGPDQGIYGGRLNWLGDDCTIITLAEKRAIAALRRMALEIWPGNEDPFQII